MLLIGVALMMKRKIVMKRIENAANRLVTFSKHRNGLLKQAFGLYVLCDVMLQLSSSHKKENFMSSHALKYKTLLNDTLCIQKKFQLTSLKWNNTCRCTHR
ncbi:hypothetical protein SLE2022_371770 [Rubroshorea leprosula]